MNGGTQLDMFNTGGNLPARTTDPDSSHTNTAARRARHARLVLDALRSLGPATDAALYSWLLREGHATEITPSSARTRRAELVRAGLVADTGRRVRNTRNRKQIVWGLSDDG